MATGAEPRPLGFKGKELIVTSDEVFNLENLPPRMVFVGGGFISFELAHVVARAGTKATILEVFDRPLAPFDADLVHMLVQCSKEAGIDIHVTSPVMSVEAKDHHFLVTAGEQKPFTLETDLVIHGAGRIPAISGLNLNQADVEVSPKGVMVNEFLQSVSNPHVYAAGDAAATSHPLTPVASMEGRIAALNIIHGNTRKVDHKGIPSAVFTHPSLASVGLREEDADRQGIPYQTIFKDTSKWSEHQRLGLRHAGFKILVDETRDRIVGAHILGDRAEEVINIFCLGHATRPFPHPDSRNNLVISIGHIQHALRSSVNHMRKNIPEYYASLQNHCFTLRPASQ